MASASNAMADKTPEFGPEWAKRQAAARGEKTPVSFMGWVRLWTRTLMLALGLLVAVPLHHVYRVISYGSPFPKWFLGYAAWVVGARVKRHGVPLRRDVFFIANHVSWVDILTLAGASGTAFVAKAELKASPLVGWLASLNRTVFVQREDRLGVAAQINALREALMDNWSVTVVPQAPRPTGSRCCRSNPPCSACWSRPRRACWCSRWCSITVRWPNGSAGSARKAGSTITSA